jgi:hypothetical protein
MEEGDGQRFMIQHVRSKNVVKMSRRKDFGTIGTTIEEMFEHTTEQTRSIYQDETVSQVAEAAYGQSTSLRISFLFQIHR